MIKSVIIRLIRIICVPVAIIMTLSACNDDIPALSLGLEEQYYLPRMKATRFMPAYTGEEYRWLMILPDGRDSLLSTEQYYTFIQKDEGTYNLRFEIIDKEFFSHDFKVTVLHEQVEYSPYIAHVLEYRPAPGQFVNEMPIYEAGDTAESMRKKTEDCISGKGNAMISLGGYGGYVTFAFDHTVMNVKGEKDFLVEGNAFYALTDPDTKGGSCEPGIVMVAFDKNLNGIPDEDEWYELAGSEYYKPETIKHYEIRYSRPNPGKAPVPDESGVLSDLTYIPWTDNQGETGYVVKNIYHRQNYYPQWLDEDELIFSGTKLRDNAVDVSGNGSYWVLYAFDWGYVDNHPAANADLNSFDIGWAVDKDGNPVYLPGVDFIRVYTGQNQTCGWIGETSTEIAKAIDLHTSPQPPPKEGE